MGPYCRFCGQRCFVHLPDDITQEALDHLKARGHGDSSLILATCEDGKAHERSKIGIDIDAIRTLIMVGHL